jgi:hypothetical protein
MRLNKMRHSILVQIVFSVSFLSLLVGNVVCQQVHIDPLSVTSLNLKILLNETPIGSATGFVVDKGDKHYLVTNRHVVLACGPDQAPANIGGWICANKVAIFQNRLGHLGDWFWVVEDLFDEHGNKLWFEHPTLAGAADLVALPLIHTENVQFYPLNLELRNTDVLVTPGDTVSVVGFPFGLAQSAGLPIWKTGTIASDLDINFNGKPMFLVDTTSRQGMSGSPVYAVRTGGTYRFSGGTQVGSATKFLGVYSEQNVNAELGGVWKAIALWDLYNSLP